MREVSQFSIDVDKVTDAASAGVNSLGDDIVSGGGDSLYTPGDARLASHTGCTPARGNPSPIQYL